MNKKLLISLSSLSTIAIVAPVLAITSCAGETPVEATNLIITAKTNPVLTNEDVALLEATDDADNTKKWTTLGKLFEGAGFVPDNKAKFTTSINKTDNIVTLTAIKGYTIDGKEKVGSNKYTIGTEPVVTDLEITAKANPVLTNEDITLLEAADDADNTKKWTTLGKLFDGAGFVPDNKAKFTTSINKTENVVTLKANKGFTINNKDSLNSNKYTIEPVVEGTNLEITAIASVKLTNADIVILEAADANAKWDVFAKLFTGKDFVSANINSKFTATFNRSKLEVTLTAAKGFVIGGQQTLSNTFTVDGSIIPIDLTITALDNPKLTEADIADLKGTNTNKQFDALKKLFTGKDLTMANLANFKITVDETAKLVTLTANDHYTIDGIKSLISKEYTLEVLPTITDLKITAKAGPITLNQVEIADLTGNNTTKQLAALIKLFEGNDLKAENLTNFVISVDQTTRIVTLTPKTNFTINGGKDKLESNQYTVQVMNLAITAITTTATLTATEVTNLTGTNNTNKLAALKKLFEGNDLTMANLANFKVAINTTTRIVTLTAEANFTISDNASLDSITFITQLEITPKEGDLQLPNPNNLLLLEDTDVKKLTALQTFFNGSSLVTEANLADFTVQIPSDRQVVILKANSNYTFIGGQTIEKTYSFPIHYKPKNLNITVKTPSPTLTPQDIATLKELPSSSNVHAQVAVLEKLFEGAPIFFASIRSFNIEVDTTAKTVTLRTKPGFVIGTTPSSTETFKTAQYQ
ncbi:MAG: hypothetical protein ACRC9U_02235 [Metamycoplasmataceae bacterium]